MKVRVLALDYDGTIASAGSLDPDVRAALEEARSRWSRTFDCVAFTSTLANRSSPHGRCRRLG
jgi:hypothetical protein